MTEIFNNKFYHATAFIILLLLFFIFVFFPSVKKINTDFPNYYVSANMFLDGKDLKDAYDNAEFNMQVLLYGIENQFVSFVPYPPVNALLMLPFARLNPLTSKLFWNILNFIFFLTSVFFISKISGLNFFLTGILFFISGYAFVNNFFFGQVYLLVLLFFSASFYFLFKEKDIPAALFFSLSVLLKFYTIFFLVLYLCRKKYRLVIASSIFIALFNLIAVILTGPEVNIFYYSKIMPRISDGWIGTVFAPEFQSVTSMLHILFYSEPSLNPDPIIKSPQLYFIFKYFFYFGILISSVLIILFLNNKSSVNNFKLQISLFCFVCMLLLPVNASYQYVILIPAIAILINYYISEKKIPAIILTLSLFFIMNSPLTVFIISVTKNQPYFFLGYLKLYILLFFWIINFILLKRLSDKKISSVTVLKYSFIYVVLVLLFSKMSLARNYFIDDGARNIFVNPNYMISMPAVMNEKIIFTECRNENFILNSNFGLKFEKENIFEPEFINEDEIKYITVCNKNIIGKKLLVNSLYDTENKSDQDFDSIQFSKDKTIKCFSKDGQIFLTDVRSGRTEQMTFGNTFNTRPVFYENDSKIIFCSDRNRGVGFTTLYELNINK